MAGRQGMNVQKGKQGFQPVSAGASKVPTTQAKVPLQQNKTSMKGQKPTTFPQKILVRIGEFSAAEQTELADANAKEKEAHTFLARLSLRATLGEGNVPLESTEMHALGRKLVDAAYKKAQVFTARAWNAKDKAFQLARWDGVSVEGRLNTAAAWAEVVTVESERVAAWEEAQRRTESLSWSLGEEDREAVSSIESGLGQARKGLAEARERAELSRKNILF